MTISADVITAESTGPGSVDLAAPPQSRVAAWMLRAVEWYQRGVQGRPSPCRFYPSCSAYVHEAVHVHGAWRGMWLGVRRLARCRPFGPSGFDPVPTPSRSSRRQKA